MSLRQDLPLKLSLTPLRSRNRRSKQDKYFKGRQAEMSFIITRSDLLAPKKEQVDSLMPYLREVLRDALGSAGEGVRLGNVRCVSAKRSWWTTQLKEDIWRRGGGGWMVGKVNVGKSKLFETVFPKGRTLASPQKGPGAGFEPQPEVKHELEDRSTTEHNPEVHEDADDKQSNVTQEMDPDSLLPPLQAETPYPVMPLVSSLPGTTASPIRVPYGNGKGELVDLPGLARGNLETFVQEEYRPSLVMRSRVKPTQHVIKPGQSLLLDGLIRITPTTPDTIILAYAFVPLSPHLTSTEKAIGIQTQQRESNVQNIALPGVGEKIRSAGTFKLKWDVTKQRAGPLTQRSAVGLKVHQLPFRVMATDILIEGCGWVELVAQARKPHADRIEELSTWQDTEAFGADRGGELQGIVPTVEVFSPEGRFIGERKPMNAWLMGGDRKPAVKDRKGRPRKSMAGAKKIAKTAKRQSLQPKDLSSE